MKPLVIRLQRVLFILVVFVAVTLPLAAAPGARKLLKLDFSEDGRTAKVQVPAGFRSVALQRFDRDGGWKKVAEKNAAAGFVRFRLPDADKKARWRAIGRFDASGASHGKFPAAFYKGGNSFDRVKSETGPGVGIPAMFRDLSGSGAFENVVPEEADIWKTDGRVVYFFNQLRGLQVLDVANPADPRLTASLRLPAVGEDLYLLPGSGRVRHLVLLTRRHDDEGAVTRIHLVKVAAGSVEVTHRQDVRGDLSDSRMVGSRLILATTEWASSIQVNGELVEESSSSRISEWLIQPGTSPQLDGEFEIPGDYPLIAAGADWLAVAVTPPGEWRFSEVTVFGLDQSGLERLTPAPIRTAGVIADKFKMQWRGNILTTISEKNRGDEWNPKTVLENFRVWGTGVIHTMMEEGRLGKLELAEGESLFATRFAGDKAYIVTFLQTDPLWIVDLTNPEKPVVAGHLEVPGWSSHLEPMGDHLFSIGWESGTLAASLFDVADPAAPKLLRRLNLGVPGSYSEAAWDEQALKVLPDAGLAMIPLTTYDEQTGETEASIQLLDLDLTAGDLGTRGTISHAFDARRADLIGGAVVSISRRVMVAADISNRDKPSILSEVSLAWPVDRVLDAGSHLLQIEDGAGYGQGRATVRISPSASPEEILAETDLGKGVARAADFRDGRLFVLREIAAGQSVLLQSTIAGTPSGKLVLDVYDGSSLPMLSLLGSVSKHIGSGSQVVGNGFLWPRQNRPTVMLDALSSFWFWDTPVLLDRAAALDARASPGQWWAWIDSHSGGRAGLHGCLLST